MAQQVSLKTATKGVETLGLWMLYSAVFEEKTSRIIGVVRAQKPKNFNNLDPDGVWVWSLKNGQVSKCDASISVPLGKTPKHVAIMIVNGKSKLVVGTAESTHLKGEVEGSQHLFETDFHTGDIDAFKEIDTSNIVTAGTCEIDPVGWKNFLFVSCIEERTLSLHVYVDLKYHSKIATPWGLEMSTFSFSDNYVVVSVYDRETSEHSILAYSWSAKKFEIEQPVFGPVPGCQYPGQVAPNIVTRLRKTVSELDTLGVYNIENKSCTQIQFGSITGTLRLVIAAEGKHFVILSDGVVYQLH